MEPNLSLLIQWTKQAGATALQFQQEGLQVSYKGQADLITQADQSIEQTLLGQISDLFPDHSVIAEESGLHSGSAEHRWFVDPIDGTINYAHRLPFYCISIAYAFQNRLELGVVYDPIRDECFSAQHGGGAWLNGKPIHASATEQLRDALLVTGFRFNLLDTAQSNLNNFVRFSNLTQSVRRLGSAALSLAYVACGRIEGFWEVSLQPWDLAAGMLIAREAGAQVGKMFGEGEMLNGATSLLAANPFIFPLMSEVLRDEWQKNRPQ